MEHPNGKISSVDEGDKSQLIDDNESPVGGASQDAAPSRSAMTPLNMDSEKDQDRVCNIGGLKVIIISVASFSVVVTVALIVNIIYGPPQVPPHGAVSCDVTRCSEIGTKILQDGGSAVDAAIATSFCLAVVHPHATGLGGGGYMMVHLNKKQAGRAYDFNGQAPGSTDANANSNYLEYQSGGRSVAIPGFVSGLEKSHKDYGRLDWSEVIQPSIDLAQDGFIVTKSLADALQNVTEPSILKAFMVNGDLATKGDTLKRPALAALLQEISDKGAEAFYTGTNADQIVNLVNGDGNGDLTLSDLEGYKTIGRSPLSINFQNKTIQSSPPPSSGVIALTALNILSNFNWTSSSNLLKSNDTYQVLLEALKFSYAQRGYIGDPDFTPIMENITLKLLSPKAGTSLSKQIDVNNTKASTFYGAAIGQVLQKGTSHVSVYGSNEDMVSITTSLSGPFGSQLMTHSGVILNNFMSDFAIPGMPLPDDMPINKYNEMQPGKRPVVPMAPAVVFSLVQPCARRLAVGGSGGTYIAQAVVEVLTEIIGIKHSVQASVKAPRLYASLYPNKVYYEADLNGGVVADLEEKGHIMESTRKILTVVNVASKVNETISAFSDPRGGGTADSF